MESCIVRDIIYEGKFLQGKFTFPEEARGEVSYVRYEIRENDTTIVEGEIKGYVSKDNLLNTLTRVLDKYYNNLSRHHFGNQIGKYWDGIIK